MKSNSLKISYISILSILILIIIPLFLLNGKYGTITFYVIPFGIGLVYALLLSINQFKATKRTFSYSFIPILLILISSIFIGGEGFICMFIILIILCIPYYLGIIVGLLIRKKIWLKNTTLGIVSIMLLAAYNTVPEYSSPVLIKDEVIINKSASAVWQLLIQPVVFGTSENFFFKYGVSYPQLMKLDTIQGKQNLIVHYNNGTIQAPIIDFNDGISFSFFLNDNLVSMKEMNVYKESHTMHLQNHFIIDYGKFEVVAQNDSTCKLVTYTQYRHKFQPSIYTDLWVTYFTHQLHEHVLNRFK